MSAVAPSATATLPRRMRVVGLLSSTDHKHIALTTGVAAFGFFVLAGILALLMRSELAWPGMQLMGDETYNELFTIHGSTMFYLFASPMAMAVGLYLVPLQIGTSNVVWPRIALLGFWLLIGAGILMWSGFLMKNGAGKSGWFAFDPLSDDTGSPGTGQDLWTLSVILAGLSGMCQAASLLATIVRRRAPGMTMLRLPVFTWGETVSCLMVVTAYPAVVVAMTLLYADRQGANVYAPPGGPILYQHLFWFFGHPVVYIVFFPFLGSIAEAIATNSGKRFFGYPFMVASLLIFSGLSMSVWGHHMFTTSSVQNRYFSLTSTMILVVAGIEYFDSLGTMWKGRIVFRSSMLFAIGFLVLFLIGGLTGVFIASPVLDYHVHDTYFIVAHFHYTLVGGSVMGLFAGLYHWFPKVTGRLLDERLGKVNFWTMVVGTLVTFTPQFILGHEGMVRRVSNYPADRGWTALNLISTVGAFIIAFSVLVFLINVARSLRLGERAGDDPWGGQTLEWATSSPPPPHNFDGVPPIRSYAPLLDIRQQAEAEERAAREAAVAHGAEEPA